MQPVESDKFAGLVRFADDKIADIGSHGERIDAYLADADLTAEGGRYFLDKHVAGDARQKEKSEGGVKGHAAGCYGQGFLPPDQIFPSLAYGGHEGAP